MKSTNLLRLPAVCEKVGLSRSEIYRLLNLGQFPAAIPIGERARAWSSEEIEAWIAERMAQRDAQKASA